MNNLVINFYINNIPRKPNGGLLIIKQHIDYLLNQDNKNNNIINIVFIIKLIKIKSIKNLISIAYVLYFFIFKAKIKWLNVNKNKLNFIYTLKKDKKIEGDVHIYTTLDHLESYKIQQNDVYFAQHWEFWSHEHSKIVELWNNKIKIITCSKWLKKYAIKQGVINNNIHSCTNSIDLNPIIQSSFDQRKYDFVFYHSNVEWKNSKITFNLLTEISQKIENNIKILIISPLKVKYKNINKNKIIIDLLINPDRKTLESKLVQVKYSIVASSLEGFCLPAAETMKSGCILFTTDCGGINDFVTNNYNGFIFSDLNMMKNFIIDIYNNKTMIDKEKISNLASKEFINKFYESKYSSSKFWNIIKGINVN